MGAVIELTDDGAPGVRQQKLLAPVVEVQTTSRRGPSAPPRDTADRPGDALPDPRALYLADDAGCDKDNRHARPGRHALVLDLRRWRTKRATPVRAGGAEALQVSHHLAGPTRTVLRAGACECATIDGPAG